MPWRGPEVQGEFPTLGYLQGAWIEAHLVIPDGPRRGEPYLLTNEMWLHLLWAGRLRPDARPHPLYPRPRDGYAYIGTQLRRSQKWGKDPFMAARTLCHCLGPDQFDGWDAAGEPVGRPVDTPRAQLAATSEDQTDNTWRPLLSMLREGPLANLPGLDAGETRVKLPGGDGWIEPVSAAARSRLGNPITWAGFTEPHLMLLADGGIAMARAMKRNLTGMGGRWMEATNAWDPTEDSVAQKTAESKRPDVYLDHRAPDLAPVDIDAEPAVRARIRIKYGDSLRSAGGWVDEDSVYADTQAADTGEAEVRRYFLDEVTVGEADAVDPTVWDSRRELGDPLRPGEAITLGFDGSRSRDGTALVACRIRDGRLFHLRTWLPPENESAPWKIDRVDVDRVLRAAFKAYTVWFLWADPFKWQDYLDTWAGLWPKRVVEFPTNQEGRMDKAIERFLTAFKAGEITHNGHPTLTEHAKNAATKKGKRKPVRDDGSRDPNAYYLHIVRKKTGLLIDAFIAAILAYAARGHAIESGALVDTTAPAPAAVPTSERGDDAGLYRPTERLKL